jgi:predicted metalloendopeptidase
MTLRTPRPIAAVFASLALASMCAAAAENGATFGQWGVETQYIAKDIAAGDDFYIGDMGGVAIAWSGYQKLVATDHRGHAPTIDGYTGNQRFFLGYAQLWRSQYADGFLRNATLTDPHSPGEFRVNGILRNFGPWYETFGVTAENKMYLPPQERVSIW